MAQVKEFIAKVLAEINEAVARSVAAGKGDKGLEVLLRYESEWALRLLQQTLEDHQNDEAEVSAESLQFCIDFLQKRYELIKNTDAIYNHHPDSCANTACIILAKNLIAALPAQAEKHHYEYLFPGLRCSDYVSSRGDLGAIGLHEFFWGDDNTPIETLACLDKYRKKIAEGEDCFPYHVCLKPESLQNRRNDQLSNIETRRLLSHSPAANKYIEAIDSKKPRKTDAELDLCRKELLDVLQDKNAVPQYTYNHKPDQSNMNLLRNGYLNAIDVTDMHSFAEVLFNGVKRRDWIAFVSAIDRDMFYQILLPKVEEKQPVGTRVVLPKQGDLQSGAAFVKKPEARPVLVKADKSVLPITLMEDRQQHRVKMVLQDLTEVIEKQDGSVVLLKPDISVLQEKFKGFVNSQKYNNDRASDKNKALLFLLTELYIHNRAGEGAAFTGALGAWSGTERGIKETAAGKLREFFTMKGHHNNNRADRPKPTYLINQIQTYLKDVDATDHLKALTSDRLGSITEKSFALGPGIQESAANLAKLAEAISQAPGNRWVDAIADVPDNLLQQYIESSGGFNKCVKSQEYKRGNHAYNKAVLFILTEHYIRSREKAPEYNNHTVPSSFFSKMTYSKNDKVEAGKIFRAFLCSDKDPSRLSEYLKERKDLSVADKAKHEAVIRDATSLFSELGTLAAQAEAVCRDDYYLPKKGWAASIASSVGYKI